MQVGMKIRALRIDKKLSQEALSQKSSVPQTTISDIELNKVNPSLSHIINLAKALEVSIGEITKDI